MCIRDSLYRAKKTLKVCLFTISEDRLSGALIDLQKKGVDVQVITDDQCKDNQGADIETMAGKGVSCRIDSREDAHMHNKFVIVDDDILINGSFNWTYSAVTKNNENVSISGDKKLITKYTEYFDKLWEEFKQGAL
eukprot:TRINITY_DN3659_c0_g1_i2.p2 TRINITY_DN3659_c0_g1~~TRINITY_DN3659_c0_g1_i2.p2  ORF type:complete len:136 (-),score=37.12 TRINITY_DN3659_c0_g1_i2:66-473(-)